MGLLICREMLEAPLGGLLGTMEVLVWTGSSLSPNHVSFVPPSFGLDPHPLFNLSPSPTVCSQLWQLQSEVNKNKTDNEQKK